MKKLGKGKLKEKGKGKGRSEKEFVSGSRLGLAWPRLEPDVPSFSTPFFLPSFLPSPGLFLPSLAHPNPMGRFTPWLMPNGLPLRFPNGNQGRKSTDWGWRGWTADRGFGKRCFVSSVSGVCPKRKWETPGTREESLPGCAGRDRRASVFLCFVWRGECRLSLGLNGGNA